MSLLQTALAYAARGWAVAPLHNIVNGKCSCGKGCDEKQAGKHPRLQHGIKEASKDPAQIRVWWTKWPDANIALACGLSGVWALDVDADRDGLETLALIQQRFGDLQTWMQRSGRGGLHLVFKMPADAKNFRQGSDHLKLDGQRLDGLDTRTGNGYILLAPSVNSGGAYEVLEEMEPAVAPTWLWHIVAPPAAPVPRVEIPTASAMVGDSPERRVCLQEILPRACADIEGAQAAGLSRHKVIHDKAHKLGGYVGMGYVYEGEITEALVQAGINAGKEEREVRRTVAAGMAIGMAKPRKLEVKGGGEVREAPDREKVMAWWSEHPLASSSDVARVWGVPAGTVRSWMHRNTQQETQQSAVAPPKVQQSAPVAVPGPQQGMQQSVEIGPKVEPVAPASMQQEMQQSGDQGGVAVQNAPKTMQHPPSATPKVFGVAPETAQHPTPSATPGVFGIAVIDQLQAIGRKVALAEGAAKKVEVLGALTELAPALVEAKANGAQGIELELEKLRKCYHGAARLVDPVLGQVRRAQPEEGPKPEADARPEILISTDIPAIVDAAIHALKPAANLFQRGGMLVHICRDRSPEESKVRWPAEVPTMREVRSPRLREMMSASASWKQARMREGGWENEPALPPLWAVDGVLCRGEWPMRKLRGISEIPIVRPDGSIFVGTGYDNETCYLCEPPMGMDIRIPAVPTLRDAEDALSTLMEPFVDFPFGDDHHLSAAIAAVLTLVARPAIDGPCPAFPLTSTTPGSGKSLIVDTISMIVTGRAMARTPHTEEDSELEKRITTVVLAGFPAVLIDNVDGTLGGQALDAALTSRTWLSRLLGRSEPVHLPLKTVWFATGNNMALRGDMARRVIPLHLEPEEERPELRTGFQHPNLLGWVEANRGRLLSAAYTLLAAHVRAGRPGHSKPRMGSFEEWDSVIRSALIWAGAPDPYGGVEQLLADGDERRNMIRGLLDAWYSTFTSEPQYLSDLSKRMDADKTPDLWEAMKAVAFGRDGRFDTNKLGNVLRRIAGRNYGGFRITRADEVRHGARPWVVRRR